jgi:hypothetical protein
MKVIVFCGISCILFVYAQAASVQNVQTIDELGIVDKPYSELTREKRQYGGGLGALGQLLGIGIGYANGGYNQGISSDLMNFTEINF